MTREDKIMLEQTAEILRQRHRIDELEAACRQAGAAISELRVAIDNLPGDPDPSLLAAFLNAAPVQALAERMGGLAIVSYPGGGFEYKATGPDDIGLMPAEAFGKGSDLRNSNKT